MIHHRNVAMEMQVKTVKSETLDIDSIMLLIYATAPEEVLLNLPDATKEDIEAAKEELWHRWVRS